jgi:hypothetical protein
MDRRTLQTSLPCDFGNVEVAKSTPTAPKWSSRPPKQTPHLAQQMVSRRGLLGGPWPFRSPQKKDRLKEPAFNLMLEATQYLAAIGAP